MESKRMWEGLKNRPDETFEDMINRMIMALQQEDDSELLTEQDIKDMEGAMKDVWWVASIHT